jgi:hypothetical protein
MGNPGRIKRRKSPALLPENESVTAKYLLPCPCGQQIVVQPRQAGETISCSCGALLQVPTLLDMTRLEQAAPEPVAPSPPPEAWGLRHRLLLLGVFLVAAAVVGVVWLYLERPVSRFDTIDPENIRQTAQKLAPSQAWNIWEGMKQGLDRRTDQGYEAAVLRFRLWQGVVAVLALLGIALVVAGMLGAKGEGSRIRN